MKTDIYSHFKETNNDIKRICRKRYISIRDIVTSRKVIKNLGLQTKKRLMN